jgi:hypothetical protein
VDVMPGKGDILHGKTQERHSTEWIQSTKNESSDSGSSATC